MLGALMSPSDTDLLNPLIPCRELLGSAFLIHQGIPYHLQEAVCQKQPLRLFFFTFISAFFFDYCTWTISRQSLRHKKSVCMWQVRSTFQGSLNSVKQTQEYTMQTQSSDSLASL